MSARRRRRGTWRASLLLEPPLLLPLVPPLLSSTSTAVTVVLDDGRPGINSDAEHRHDRDNDTHHSFLVNSADITYCYQNFSL